MEICERTFELVAEQLSALKYDGPMALSCDDTKLLSCLRLYWDPKENSHFLVGAVGGPLRVLDPELIPQVVAAAKLVNATKVSPQFV